RPSNESASDCLPFGPSNKYSLVTLTQGRLRRSKLSSSCTRVNSFSLRRSFARASSHSASETSLCLLTTSFIFLASDRFKLEVNMPLPQGWLFRSSVHHCGPSIGR